jgi:hypothetical protein
MDLVSVLTLSFSLWFFGGEQSRSLVEPRDFFRKQGIGGILIA